MSSLPIRVIKLGGSLLNWDQWPVKFRQWLAEHPTARSVLIVGGGRLVDGLRELDAAHHLPPEQSHWLAIDLMSITARVAAALVHEAYFTDQIDELQSDAAPNLIVFDPASFLRFVEPTLPPPALLRDWTVTSDSIAARIAVAIGARELVLLKSASPTDGRQSQVDGQRYTAGPARSHDLLSLAKAGYVDEFFPQAAASIDTIRLVNLRD